jgi:hypothetical protein
MTSVRAVILSKIAQCIGCSEINYVLICSAIAIEKLAILILNSLI